MSDYRKLLIALGVILASLGISVGVASATHGPKSRAAAAVCSDSSTLQALINAAPSNSTLTLTADACFTGSLHIANTTGLTVNANGSTLTQAAQSSGNNPILFLTRNHNLTIENLNAAGGYTGSNGGVSYEGDYGILAEANHGLTIRGSTFSDVQGDFINLETDYADNTGDLNTSVMVTGDKFTNAGYHGITLEAVDGATFSHDSFDGMGPDAIDAEADIYSTNIAVGEGRYRAENNVDIRQDEFSGWQDDWFSSLQGQVPGVQEQHIKLDNNALENVESPLIEILATPLSETTSPYYFNGLSVEGNIGTGIAGAKAVRGSEGNWGIDIQNVAGVTITGNTIPYADGYCDPPYPYVYQCNTPATYVASLQDIVYASLSNNSFPGAVGILSPISQEPSAYLQECGNRYGVGAALADAGC